MKSINLLLFFTFCLFSLKSNAQILVWNGNGDGISWHDAANWTGGLLPDSTKTIQIDNGDSVVVSTNIKVNNLLIYNNSKLNIRPTKNLRIKGLTQNSISDGLSLFSGSKVDNFGTIDIQSSAGKALNISDEDGKFVNKAGAFLAINSSHLAADYGIYINGSFLNQTTGQINLDYGTNEGILVKNSMENRGMISIDSTDSYSLYVSFQDTLTNSGNITLRATQLSGIYNQGYIKNSGKIETEYSKSYSYSGSSNSVLENTSTGKLTFSNGCYFSGTISNENLLVVQTNPIYAFFISSGNFVNSDTVLVSQFNQNGISLSANATLTNTSSGKILSDSININGGYSSIITYASSSIINNYGLISAKTISPGTAINITGGTLNNFQVIELEGGLNSLFNFGGKFINNTDGLLTITNSSNGIYNLDTLTNLGKIVLTKTKNGGLGSLVNSGTKALFTNSDSLLFLQDPKAILNTKGASFENNGFVFIDSSYSSYSIENQSKFINDGQIMIERSTGTALLNKTYLADFVNNNDLFISNSFYPSIVATDTSYFRNFSYMILDTGITINNAAIFNNFGLMHQKTKMPNNTLNGFSNFGVWHTLTPITFAPYCNNLGIILSPRNGPLSSGIKEKPALKVGSLPYPVNTNWYLNETRTQLAGTYNNTDNTFLPNANYTTDINLFLNIEIGGREWEMPALPWTVTPSCQLIHAPVCTFTGGTIILENKESSSKKLAIDESEDWFKAGNWDCGQVPDYCTPAIVPSGKICRIEPGIRAKAPKILIESGAVFESQTGSVLDAHFVFF